MNSSDFSGLVGGSPRSYVVRQGRITKRQQRGLSEGLPKYQLESFPKADRVVLEIGFGMGQSLIEMAEKQPETTFIGIEVHPPGMGAFLADVMDQGLQNILVVQHDAIEVLQQQIPDQSLDVVQVFFPDPWHKKRHNKRRLVNQRFLELVHAKLKPGAEFHMATDWGEYAQQVMQLLSDSDQWKNSCQNNGFYHNTDRRPETKFERRGKRLGHGVWDLIFSRA